MISIFTTLKFTLKPTIFNIHPKIMPQFQFKAHFRANIVKTFYLGAGGKPPDPQCPPGDWVAIWLKLPCFPTQTPGEPPGVFKGNAWGDGSYLA